MSVQTLSPAAWHAIKAVDIYKRCGRFSAMRYAVKNDVVGLYRLARQLAAVSAVSA